MSNLLLAIRCRGRAEVLRIIAEDWALDQRLLMFAMAEEYDRRALEADQDERLGEMDMRLGNGGTGPPEAKPGTPKAAGPDGTAPTFNR